ncbi:microtubule-associated tumor suppressor 1 homolog A [Pseudochaenichthys georgianus]|uniref:microtubule-associated tumor suppressor 1 homolog A n=1 Tax=Pseudochaenichthys georgianus TaxID=52239 RepID=UPI001469A781|nr:microtubule-associated tumor suppressor 1 homolog A [Pseudochaenichthys georgianus]
MSKTTLSMSTDQVASTVPPPHREALSPESLYSSSLSPSPDSHSSISNPSDREANSSPECCLSDTSSLDNLYNTTLPKDPLLSDVSLNLNQTFIATPVNGSVNFWNDNLSLMSSHESESDKYHTFSENTEDGSSCAVMSPDSVGSRLSSVDTSRRGSPENDFCSLSSGEMVIRTNSFCLEDHSLVVSSLDESSMSLAAGHSTFPSESNLLSTTLPDVFEKSSEKVVEENMGHMCFGLTFTEDMQPREENDMATSSPLVALPAENEGALLKTFVCEKSPANCGKEAQIARAQKEPSLCFTAAFTPEQGDTFVHSPSVMQDTDHVIHTSTPVQSIGNMIPSPPSFPVSPCTENTGNPGHNPVKRQQNSAAPNHLVAVTKVKKMEIKKFPKSDFSSIKSKIVTRNVHQLSVSGSSSQLKPSQVNVYNKHTEAQRGATDSISPTNLRSSTAIVSTTTKVVNDAPRRMTTGAANSVAPQSSGPTATSGQGQSGACKPGPNTAANKPASEVCSNASFATEQAASCQAAETATAEHSGNQTFCFSSSGKSPDRSDPKPIPKKGVLDQIKVASGSAVGQAEPSVPKTRLRCSSESLSPSSRPPREKSATARFSASFTTPNVKIHPGLTRTGNSSSNSLNKQAIPTEAGNRPVKNSSREVKRISLVLESSEVTTTGASSDERKSTFRARPAPRQTAQLLQPPPASPRASPLSSRLRQPTGGRDDFKASKAGTPQSKLKSSTGSPRVQTGESAHENVSTSSIKAQLNGFRLPQTSSRPSLMGPPPTPSSRLPRKTLGPSRSLTEPSEGSTHVSGGAAPKPSRLKTGKNTGPPLTAACKPASAFSIRGASNSTVSPLKRTASARLVRPTPNGPVDNNKPKAAPRQQHPQQPTSQPSQRSGPPDVVPVSVAEGGRKAQSVQQLGGLLAASNQRCEAVAIVLQRALAERDEATRHCRDLSQELVTLQGELVCSVHSSEHLEKERDELRASLEEALQKLQDQHQRDLLELEQRLQALYQAEWDRVQLSHQEESERSLTLLQQQMEELKATHESMKQEVESSHAEQLQSVEQQYEASLQELRTVHDQELQSLDASLKETGDTLSGRIEVLTAENNALIEKLSAMENRRKQLAEKSQKDSHTLYLEQELDSLKVVLDIKNKQLHQQEKKLMEIGKLTEKSVKLDESLQKVQQENEDLRARMERHYALSRQLSTEQAVLQESLTKESKVNKRLSMENEELMWKLHNGDLSSPRKVSPTSTSPSRSFSLQSPRSSGVFSSPPVSPR